MIGYWISFVALFPIIVLGALGLKWWSQKNIKVEITPEMEKAAWERVIKYILFYWLCNLFYMACFKNSIAWKYIFGGLIMLIIFMNLANAFTIPHARTKFENWGLLQDFLVGIGLSVYLIYIIPNTELKAVVTPIVAAMFGGLLTLVGVAWTIRQGQKERAEDRKQLEEDRKEEERKKYLPFVNLYKGKAKTTTTIYFLQNSDNSGTTGIHQIKNFRVKNTDFSSFSISNIKIDDIDYFVNPNWFIEKKAVVKFDLSNIFLDKIPTNISISIEDMIGNNYTIGLEFKNPKGNVTEIIGCYRAIIEERKN